MFSTWLAESLRLAAPLQYVVEYIHSSRRSSSRQTANRDADASSILDRRKLARKSIGAVRMMSLSINTSCVVLLLLFQAHTVHSTHAPYVCVCVS